MEKRQHKSECKWVKAGLVGIHTAASWSSSETSRRGLIYWHGFSDKAVGFCTTRSEACKKPLTAFATAESSLLSLPLDRNIDSSAGFY